MLDEFDSWVEPVKVQMGRPAPVSPEDFDVDRAGVYTALWFDPGMTTGWALMSVWRVALASEKYRVLNNIVAWSTGEFLGSEDQVIDQMAELADAWDGNLDGIGLEDFILRKFTMGRELLAPVRVTSRFEDRMYVTGRSSLLLPKQSASLAFSTVDDERLKRWGLYGPTVGKKDARAALKHTLTFFKNLKAHGLKEAGE